MTKERLEELLDIAYESVESDAETPYGEALVEACLEIERLQAALNGKSSLNPFSYIARLAGINPYAIWDTGNPHCHFCMNIPALHHEPNCLWADAARLARELGLEVASKS